MTRDFNRNSYDEIPYPSLPKPESHPSRLGSLATLLGMSPAPVERCRVLELACSDGGNIVPMACNLPASDFVGVDLSARQIADGREMIAALGLQNIRLEQASILDVDPAFGQFDYIIAYGVFSWVDRPVQEAIFEVCQRHLSPQGVAYISYNTYPGWHLRQLLRDMMLYHTRKSTDLRASTAQSRELLKALVDSSQAIAESRRSTTLDMKSYGMLLTREQDLLDRRPDLYLAHELLEDYNDPVYFSDFMERAARHGLQYVSEADYYSTQVKNFPAGVAEKLGQWAGNVVETEQYIDFLLNRTFRQTLLCRDDIALDREPKPERLANLYVSSPVMPASADINLTDNISERFRAPSGTVVSVRTPVAKAAMVYLGEVWPLAVSFKSLLNRAQARMDPNWLPVQEAERVERDTQSLADMLLKFYTVDMVELHAAKPAFVTHISERPVAHPLVRLLGKRGGDITNGRHEPIALGEDLSRHLAPLLDGTRDRAALLAAVEKLVSEGVLVAGAPDETPDGGPPSKAGEAQGRDMLEKALDKTLERMARAALLAG
jgi:methyltransferase-like protein/2-polyprenyl-3-methyl-5-hydroxy-6-metoxy-1,4-benzoquinol methylase